MSSAHSNAQFSPENLQMIAEVAEALSVPHRRSFWITPNVIPISTPNNEPIGALVWCTRRQVYRFHVGDVDAS